MLLFSPFLLISLSDDAKFKIKKIKFFSSVLQYYVEFLVCLCSYASSLSRQNRGDGQCANWDGGMSACCTVDSSVNAGSRIMLCGATIVHVRAIS